MCSVFISQSHTCGTQLQQVDSLDIMVLLASAEEPSSLSAMLLGACSSPAESETSELIKNNNYLSSLNLH